jgi:hypothetical protein
MTYSTTRSSTFTVTEARYIGAKLGTDLRLLHNLYGRPCLTDIEDYAEESALLLKDGYLNTVDFGFKAGDVWKLRLRYTATAGGQLRDDPPGRLPAPIDIAGLGFHSYLMYSQKFFALLQSTQSQVKADLPITRTPGTEPTLGSGSHSGGHGYGKNGAGVTRDTFSAY